MSRRSPSRRTANARRKARLTAVGLVWAGTFFAIAARAVAPMIDTAWTATVTAENGLYLAELKSFFMLSALPAALAVLALTLTGAVIGALLGAATARLPQRAIGIIDAVMLFTAGVALLETAGVLPLLRALDLGPAATLALSWVVVFALSGMLWNHLPFGLTLRQTVSRTVPVPVHLARDRLLPDRDPAVTLADAALSHAGDEVPPGFVTVTQHRLSIDRHRLSDAPSHGVRRQLTWQITDAGAGCSRLTAEIVITGLSPIAAWELFTRGFGEDYLDHIAARLTGRPDPSVYGAEVARHLARRPGHARPGIGNRLRNAG